MMTDLRCEFLEEVGDGKPMDADLRQAIADYFSSKISFGEFVAFYALADGRPVAGSGLVFRHCPPSPKCRSGIGAYIMNMYAAPAWRGKGIATALLKELFNVARKAQCNSVRLHALPKAQNVYAKMGFKAVEGEMELAP
jgi:GNAT superfamily N-acetyltransferase